MSMQSSAEAGEADGRDLFKQSVEKRIINVHHAATSL